jgi:DNA (cytosine-5)-methyltransferase 1
MSKLRVLDLFSGIGGFSLGLERAGGFETVAFCEIEPYCRKVLAKHWPGVKQYDDVRTLTADTLRRDGITVDVICGGFPCQDLSFAGKRAGLSGARSGLWGEYRRLIGELRPRFVIAENVPGILSLGLGSVLSDLAALGYDACWECIPASAVGAPHRRDRWWLVGHPNSRSQSVSAVDDEAPRLPGVVPDANQIRQPGQQRRDEAWEANAIGRRGEDLADADKTGLSIDQGRPARWEHGGVGRFGANRSAGGECHQWSFEPDVGRVAHGVPSRVDRLGALGNAVVPQIPELIGRAIMQAEGEIA